MDGVNLIINKTPQSPGETAPISARRLAAAGRFLRVPCETHDLT